MKKNKTKRLGIRLSEENFNEVHLAAEEMGLTTSEYVRYLLKITNQLKESLISDYALNIVQFKRGVSYDDPTDKWVNAGRIIELKRMIKALIDDLDFETDKRIIKAVKEWEDFYNLKF